MKFIPCEYTENMYMGKKSSFWTSFNMNRINKIKDIISKIDTENKNILEIGSYDFYFIYFCLFNGLLGNAKKIDMSDLYNEGKKKLENETNNNLKLFRENYKNIEFNKISSNLEEFDIKNKYDLVFIFETLEHVNDEETSINNLYNVLNYGGKIIVSVPAEHGGLFFIKYLGRRILLRKDYHSFKELLYGLIGRVDKIRRVPRQHKGYDYRNTRKILLNKGFKLHEENFTHLISDLLLIELFGP